MAAPLQSIGGLASGLDTNTIIGQLMSIEQAPMLRMKQQQGVERARQQALKDVQTRLQSLQTTAKGLRDSATWSETQTVTSSDSTKVSVTKTGGPPAGSWNLQITNLARAEQWATDGTKSAAGVTGTMRVTVNGSFIDVPVASGDSLDTIAKAINGATGTPVQASVVNGKLLVSGRTTGAANTIAFSTQSGANVAADLGLAKTVGAGDASYTLDGVAKTSSTNTIDDAVPGLRLTLGGATNGSTVSVTVGDLRPDNAAIKGKIQAFVDQYNSTLDFVRSKLDEATVRNPKTQSDREKGVLRGDSQLTGLLSSMRSALADTVAGLPTTMRQAAQAGLSTGATTGTGTINQDAVAGKLTLDGAKLDAALANDFASVKSLFTTTASDYSSQGLGVRLDTVLTTQLSTTTGILTGRISSEDTMIKRFDDDQAALQIRLDLRESALRSQFTAMETALSHSQQQGNWLAGQLAGLR